MRSLKSLKHALIVCAITLCVPMIANATPSLGVQPSPLVTYQEYSGHGIPSGGDLDITVWFGRPNGTLSDADKAADIWLLTNSAYGDDFLFGGVDFKPLNLTKKITGYHDQIAGAPVNYFGVNLGSVLDTSKGWASAPPTFLPGEFYFNSNTLTYSNLVADEWFFAVADFANGASARTLASNGFVFNNGKDEVSPQTTGSTVPEPASMLLFGTGLVGLAGAARRRSKR